MKVGHTSDLHGSINRVLHEKKNANFDVWIDTGDFFNDLGRIDPRSKENIDFQIKQAKTYAPAIAQWLNGRPCLYTPGNHDRILLGDYLKEIGYDNVYQVTHKGHSYKGKMFAGMPYVPEMNGIWNYELEHAFLKEETSKLFSSNPDILLVHCPPFGVRDMCWSGDHIGNVHLSDMITYHDHKVTHIYCGHCHESRGVQKILDNIFVLNGATRWSMWEI